MLVEQERHGDMVDRTLLKSLLRMLSDLQIYKDAFEKKFLQATEKLYAAEGQRLINERDVPEYLNHVEKRIKEENERLVHYLDSSSKWQLIHMIEKQLISEHLSTILTKGMDNYFNIKGGASTVGGGQHTFAILPIFVLYYLKVWIICWSKIERKN